MARSSLRFVGSLFPLLVGSGLAVTITGSFGIISTRLAEPMTRTQSRCALAAQIVTDESLNPALDKAISTKMTNDAALRVVQCIKDDGHA